MVVRTTGKSGAWYSLFGSVFRHVSCALLFCITVFSSAVAENRHGIAVIIGNSGYSHADVPDVAYAHRDADAFRNYVVDVLGYREENIIDLRDASQAQMTAAFGVRGNHKGIIWQYYREGRSDVVVYYSGHGVPGQNDGNGYLLPSNAAPTAVELNGYPIDVLYENLAALGARSVTVFLDACFSGASHAGMLIQTASPVFVSAELPESGGEGLTVLTAASGDQLASWDEEHEHGLFTRYLLEGLYGEADRESVGNGDGQVSVSELKAWLDEEMTYSARRLYRRIQEATVIGDLDRILAPVPDQGWRELETVEVPPGENELAAVLATESTDEPELFFTVSALEAVLYAQSRSNLRAGPGTNFDRVGQLQLGDEVVVTGRVDDLDWFRVSLAGGDQAFVYVPLLGDENPVDVAAREAEAARLAEELRLAEEVARTEEERRLAEELRQLEELERNQVAVGTYLNPGTVFRDCAECPEMIVIPAGRFLMGSPDDEEGRYRNEGPVREVQIPEPFAVGRFEVTIGQWAACVDSGGCNDDGMGAALDENRPITGIDWHDAKAYAAWMSSLTGERYRLLSEAEWEYAARGGTQTRYWWGDNIDPNLVNYVDNGLGSRPVGSFPANPFGLFEILGNVEEWTEDCYNDRYTNGPRDGSAWTSGICTSRIIRGGSWQNDEDEVRSAERFPIYDDTTNHPIGIRIARDIN